MFLMSKKTWKKMNETGKQQYINFEHNATLVTEKNNTKLSHFFAKTIPIELADTIDNAHFFTNNKP